MYQIVYRDEGRQQKLYGPDVCAGLFRPKMTADGFKRWAREHNCPPDVYKRQGETVRLRGNRGIHH